MSSRQSPGSAIRCSVVSLSRCVGPPRRSKLSSGLLAQRQASSSKPAVLGVSSVDEFLDRLEPVYPQMYPI
jgi:hypothetical protein